MGHGYESYDSIREFILYLSFLLLGIRHNCISKGKRPNSFSYIQLLEFLIASLLILPFCEIDAVIQVTNYDYIFWINMILLSIVVMSFANTMYFFASSKIGAIKASSYIFVVPLTAIIFSKIILKEQILSTTILAVCYRYLQSI